MIDTHTAAARPSIDLTVMPRLHGGRPARQGLVLMVLLMVLTLAAWLVPGRAQAQAAASAARQEYIIGAGDVLRINVYQSADLTLEARVSESGTISYPLLGTLTLGGDDRLLAGGTRLVDPAHTEGIFGKRGKKGAAEY